MFNRIRKYVLLALGFLSIASIFFVTSHELHAKSTQSFYQKSDENFKYAMSIVLLHEGGLTNNKNDKGGITNYGISLRYLKAENIDIDGDGDVDADDVIKITPQKANDIYFKDWWKKYRYNQIRDKVIAAKIMDISVNAGASRAHKILKKALNHIVYESLSIDGYFDDETIAIVNNIDLNMLHKFINMEEIAFYQSIVKKTPSFNVFLKGWINRANW